MGHAAGLWQVMSGLSGRYEESLPVRRVAGHCGALAAQLNCIGEQRCNEPNLEAIQVPEGEAAGGVCIVQVGHHLAEQQGDHRGKHVVHGQRAKAQRGDVAWVEGRGGRVRLGAGPAGCC